MAWIKMIKEDEAHDYLRTLYKKYGDPFEGVANIWKIHSFNPEALRFHYDFYKHLSTGKSGLSRMQREMIGLVVSTVNQCEYAIVHHGESLFQLTKNGSLIDGIKKDFRKLNIGDKDIGMLEHAEKLTKCPWDIEKADIDKLRDLGFKESDILDITLVAAYFAFVTRIASGLGVELEEYWKDK
ncbi:MAG: peroxidase-related enzyme [Candidatus Latescibacteria bacterium]|nr:peroxidase-related enzyme [Candidatus Latescibacterota bacterium]NIM22255.1 peroxidase-related enzyme [Candidatus Latescibacterota bacterium]NIM65734.1 peroxidase-related enzyme [Candidatus Latescibacterota bacterium]NIO02119.1 peroxidase-related enzyme [Candidatus Latescibacterota bacterium]NIO28951.1 peroxidase-related enzyme [Candidatus Latescibacterota bacterium]